MGGQMGVRWGRPHSWEFLELPGEGSEGSGGVLRVWGGSEGLGVFRGLGGFVVWGISGVSGAFRGSAEVSGVLGGF